MAAGTRWDELPWAEIRQQGRLAARVCDYFESRGLRCFECHRGAVGLGYFIDDESPQTAREGFPTLFRAAHCALSIAAHAADLALDALRRHESEKRRSACVPESLFEESGASKPAAPRAADALEPPAHRGGPSRG